MQSNDIADIVVDIADIAAADNGEKATFRPSVCLVAKMWEQLKTSVKLGCYEYIWIFANDIILQNNIWLMAGLVQFG